MIDMWRVKFNLYLKRLEKRFFKNVIFSSYLVLLLLLSIIAVPKIFAELQPVKSIEIYSDKLDYKKNEAGSWKITKSAKWISKGIAEITFDVDTIKKTKSKYTDVLFVLDVSGSMDGDKLNRVKADTIEVLDDLLSYDGNRAGLISFDTDSEVISDFTNNKNELMSKINTLRVNGNTNYYQALVNVDSILKNYVNNDDRECVILFLTDGYPNEETPNEVGQYNYLKSQYPFVTINGVQYEMGKTVFEQIEKVTDNQYIADMDTLNNVLFEASFDPLSYDYFEIDDFVDTNYFYIEDEDNIKVNQGDFIFDKNNQSFTWKIDNLKSGSKSEMTIKAKLREKFIGGGGFYPTNKQEIVRSKIEDVEEKKSSTKTPVLADNYKVIYDGNAPSGCRIEDVPDSKQYSVFDIVGISDSVPKCDGYQFKGWKITSDGVKKINDDYFVMPDSDVSIRAIWSKTDIKKSMSGKVKENLNLYRQVKEDSKVPEKFATEYTGDTSAFVGKEKVYYYYGEAKDNNVIFADYCWKIVRTTDTGGVKILYNGLPVNGQCNSTAGTDTLTGEQMGTSSNSIVFNSDDSSLADGGYMYNTRYEFSVRGMRKRNDYLDSKSMSQNENYSFYYADSYNYDNSIYSLIDAKKIDWKGSSTENLVGKYTFFSSSNSGTSTSICYILETTSDEIRYIRLENGKNINDAGHETMIAVGDSISGNSIDGYTLNNPIMVNKVDLYPNESSYVGKYTCGGTNTSCENMQYIQDIYSTYYAYSYEKDKYKYGKSFTWDGENYLLTDMVDNFGYGNIGDLDSHHYTCFNTDGVCSSLLYIYHESSGYLYYITLENGKSIEDALGEMLYDDDVNTNDSVVKKAIDNWYQNNMVQYTEYLEDTIWCNNRSVSDIAGWKSNGGSLTSQLNFESNSDLACPNKNDKLTVDKSSGGTGTLTYPVALLTVGEANLAYYSKNSFSSPFFNTWLMTPEGFGVVNYEGMYIRDIWQNGYIGGARSSYVKPAISLRPGIEYVSGNGSSENPYVIDMGNEHFINVDDTNVSINVDKAVFGKKVTLYSKDDNYRVASFKMNGVVVKGNSFFMPTEDVFITDVVLSEITFIESDHNPYSNYLNDIRSKRFDGATSLTVELEYQTEGINYDWVYLYDSTGKQYGKYGGNAKKTVVITIPGDYVKILFRTDGSGNNYYGYKATITPNYG